MEIVNPELNGWRRIKDFVHDPQVHYYVVIAVGRPIDLVRFKDGKFVDIDHDDWESDVLYWMPIPNDPPEKDQWFYGHPNGFQLRTQPPWLSTEVWNESLRREQEEQATLEAEHPVGSTVTFRSRHGDHKRRTGIVKAVSAGTYSVDIGNESWCVEPEEIE